VSAGSPARRDELLRSWWILLTLGPIGLTGWGALVYAGVRAKRPHWVVFGLVYLAAVVVAFALISATADDSKASAIGGALLLGAWAVPFVHALAIRRAYLERTTDPALVAAEARLARRDRALELAHEDPRRARELGVGRPDLSESFHGGVVDVNNAPEKAIARLPGVGKRLARRIVDVREEIDGFSSLDDMGSVMNLPAALVDRLRRETVFLPRD